MNALDKTVRGGRFVEPRSEPAGRRGESPSAGSGAGPPAIRYPVFGNGASLPLVLAYRPIPPRRFQAERKNGFHGLPGKEVLCGLIRSEIDKVAAVTAP